LREKQFSFSLDVGWWRLEFLFCASVSPWLNFRPIQEGFMAEKWRQKHKKEIHISDSTFGSSFFATFASLV
jgi:hypothetical protein